MLKKVTQKIEYLIGSKDDIKNLAVKDHARVLVLSDSHGHTSLLEKIIRQYGKECDALGFCGDGIGDLMQIIDLTKVDKALQESLPPVIAFAQGNGDPSTYPLYNFHLNVKIPTSQVLTVNNRKLSFTHGHRQGVDFGMEIYGLEMQTTGAKVGFFGHTHIAYEENTGDYKFVNPGSIGRPRGGQPACFAIATVEKNFVDIAYIKIGTGSDGEKEFQIWNPIF